MPTFQASYGAIGRSLTYQAAILPMGILEE